MDNTRQCPQCDREMPWDSRAKSWLCLQASCGFIDGPKNGYVERNELLAEVGHLRETLDEAKLRIVWLESAIQEQADRSDESNKGILNESLCYLIGAIDQASDLGSGWRNRFMDECKLSGLNIKFLDPTNKVTGLQSESQDEHKRIVMLKDQERWDELHEFMYCIVREDHRSVDLSDFVVFYLDPSVHTCGSYFELQSALTGKKPYFIIIEGGKEKTPAWLFGICDHNQFFGSIDSVVEELTLLDSGRSPLSDRWVLFRKQIKDL